MRFVTLNVNILLRTSCLVKLISSNQLNSNTELLAVLFFKSHIKSSAFRLIAFTLTARSADVSASHDFMMSLREVNNNRGATAAMAGRDRASPAAQPHNKMIVKHTFVPCVEDELQVRQGEC